MVVEGFTQEERCSPHFFFVVLAFEQTIFMISVQHKTFLFPFYFPKHLVLYSTLFKLPNNSFYDCCIHNLWYSYMPGIYTEILHKIDATFCNNVSDAKESIKKYIYMIFRLQCYSAFLCGRFVSGKAGWQGYKANITAPSWVVTQFSQAIQWHNIFNMIQLQLP